MDAELPDWVILSDAYLGIHFWWSDESKVSISFRVFGVGGEDDKWLIISQSIPYQLAEWDGDDMDDWEIDGDIMHNGCINWRTNPDVMAHACDPSMAKDMGDLFTTIYHVAGINMGTDVGEYPDLPETAVVIALQDKVTT